MNGDAPAGRGVGAGSGILTQGPTGSGLIVDALDRDAQGPQLEKPAGAGAEQSQLGGHCPGVLKHMVSPREWTDGLRIDRGDFLLQAALAVALGPFHGLDPAHALSGRLTAALDRIRGVALGGGFEAAQLHLTGSCFRQRPNPWPALIYSAPKTFFSRSLPAPSGLARSFFSSSAIIRNRPSIAFWVT